MKIVGAGSEFAVHVSVVVTPICSGVDGAAAMVGASLSKINISEYDNCYLVGSPL